MAQWLRRWSVNLKVNSSIRLAFIFLGFPFCSHLPPTARHSHHTTPQCCLDMSATSPDAFEPLSGNSGFGSLITSPSLFTPLFTALLDLARLCSHCALALHVISPRDPDSFPMNLAQPASCLAPFGLGTPSRIQSVVTLDCLPLARLCA